MSLIERLSEGEWTKTVVQGPNPTAFTTDETPTIREAKAQLEAMQAEIDRLREQVAGFEAADAAREESARKAWEYYQNSTCPCEASERYVSTCPKHGRASLHGQEPSSGS